MNRRNFLTQLGAAAAVPVLASADQFTGRIFKAVKVSMIRGKMPLLDKFKIAQDAGFDGISLFAPDMFDLREALVAQDKTGVRIHNINDSVHWKVRLTDADPAVRAKALQAMKDALQFAHDCGADSILLVIGKVTDPTSENEQQVRARSIENIRKAIPVAARLGVRILCENVGNGFLPDAKQWAEYLDVFDSPWVGALFDIGNHDGYGGAPHWIRTLDHRVIKIDVKDRNRDRNKNCDLFEGHVDWPGVRQALHGIRFNGWATAEVSAGDAARMKQVVERMNKALRI